MKFSGQPKTHMVFSACLGFVVGTLFILTPVSAGTIPWNPSAKACTLFLDQGRGKWHDYNRDGLLRKRECLKYGIQITSRRCALGSDSRVDTKYFINPLATNDYSCNTRSYFDDLDACARVMGYVECRVKADKICPDLQIGSKVLTTRVVPFYWKALGAYTGGFDFTILPDENQRIFVDTAFTDSALPGEDCSTEAPYVWLEYTEYTYEISVAGLSESQADDIADSFNSWAGYGGLPDNVSKWDVEVVKDRSYRQYRGFDGKPLYDLYVARITISLETELSPSVSLASTATLSDMALEAVLTFFTYGFLSLPISEFDQQINTSTWPGRILTVTLLAPGNTEQPFFAQVALRIEVVMSDYGNYPLQFTDYPDKISLDLTNPRNTGVDCEPLREAYGGEIPINTVCFPFRVSVGKGNGDTRSVSAEVISQGDEYKKFFTASVVVGDADVAQDLRTATLGLVLTPGGNVQATDDTAINLHVRFANTVFGEDSNPLMNDTLYVQNSQITLTGNPAPMILTNNGDPLTTEVVPGSGPVVIALTAQAVQQFWSFTPSDDRRLSLSEGSGAENATFIPGSGWTEDSQASFVVAVSDTVQSDSITLNFVGIPEGGGGNGGGGNGGGGNGGGGNGGGGNGGGGNGGGGNGGGGEGFVHDLISEAVQTQVRISLMAENTYGSQILSWETLGAAPDAITWLTASGVPPYGVGRISGSFSYYRPYGQASGSENNFKVQISDVTGKVLETFPIDITFN